MSVTWYDHDGLPVDHRLAITTADSMGSGWAHLTTLEQVQHRAVCAYVDLWRDNPETRSAWSLWLRTMLPQTVSVFEESTGWHAIDSSTALEITRVCRDMRARCGPDGRPA